MSNVNANINVNVNTQQALAQIQALQSKIGAFNKSVIASNAAAVASQKSLNATLAAQIGATRAFTTSLTTVETGVGRLQGAIDKNKLSMGEYFRYGVASSRTFGKVFKKEHMEMTALATERVKRLQTQYLALGAAQNGVTKAMAVRPMALFGADMAVSIQRQQLFNKLLTDGSTSIINWGKNTQWAGRQLMVGFTIPLTIFGAAASKVFMDLEKEAINFKKVYGDIFTTDVEVEQNLSAVKELSQEMTKYGIAVKDTMALAGVAAQAGLRSQDLMAATEQATRLAVLGQMEQAEAMKTVISMQTAFQQSNEQLAESVDFLNIIENQTVLSLQDVAGAIPRVAPVIQGMGGDIKDLAILLVAMREGGVSAAEGANALKNSLARLIDPTTRAIKVAREFGINLEDIVERNRGEVLPTIIELAKAMGDLEGPDEQKLLATVFGKFQYARIGALMKNIRDDSSQAARAMDLMGMSAEQLAETADKELGVVEQAISTKFTAAMERAKLAIAPIGEIFLKIATPILGAISNLFEKFNELSPTVKNFITVLVAGIGIAAPAIIMLVGLFGNLIGNGLKIIAVIGRLFSRLKGTGDGAKYLSGAQLDAAAAASSLEGRTTRLTGALNVQQRAVNSLAAAYQSYVIGARSAAAALPQGFAGPASRIAPRRMARGGMVGGTGRGDTEPALLTPGEFVINADASKQFAPLLSAINEGRVGKFANGRTFNVGGQQIVLDVQSASTAAAIERRIAGAAKLGDDALRKLAQVLNGLSGQITSVSKQIDPIIRSTSQISGLVPSEKRYGAPTSIQKQTEKMTWATREAEVAAIQSDVAKKWPDIAKDTSKMRNLTNTQASHIEIMDKAGKNIAKDWKNLANLTPDLGAYNNYLNRVKGMELGAADMLKIQKQTGLTADQVNVEMAKLKNQVHPTTVAAQKVLRSVAKIDEQASLTAIEMGKVRTRIGTVAATGYQATAVASGYGVRDVAAYSAMSKSQPYLPAAAGMVQGATVAARSAQQSSSPSRVMAKVGDEFGQGFATGINRQRGAVQGAARSLVLGGTAAAQQQARLSASQMRGAVAIGGAGTFAAPLPLMGGLPVAPGRIQEQIAGAAAGGGGGGRPPVFLGMPGMPGGDLPKNMAATSAELSRTRKMLSGFGKSVQNASGKMFGVTAGLSGLAFGLSMMDNSVGQFAQKIMPVVFAISGLQMVLPMLLRVVPLLVSPMGLAAAAIGAVVGGFWLVKKTSDDMSRRGKELAQAMYGTSKSMNDVASFFDRKTFSQQLEGMRAARARGGQEITEEQASSAKQFIESDAGKQLVSGIRTAQEVGGSEMATKALQNQLKRMIVSGAIAPEMADAIALELATELNDRNIGFKAIANIRKLIGPDGVDLEDSEIRMKIIAEIIADSDPVSDAMTQAGLIWDGSSWFSQVAMIISGAGTVDIFAENLSEQVQQQREIISGEIDALTLSFSQGKISVDEYVKSLTGIQEAAPQFDYSGLMQAGFDQFGQDFDDSAQDKLGQSLVDSLWDSMRRQMGNKKADELFHNFKRDVLIETQEVMNMMTGEMQEVDITRSVNLFDPQKVRQAINDLREVGKEAEAIALEKDFNVVMNLSTEIASGEISPQAVQAILDSGEDIIEAYAKLSLNAVEFPDEETKILFMAAQKVLDEDSLTLPILIRLRQEGDFEKLSDLSRLTLRAEQLDNVDIDIEIKLSGTDYEEIERSIARVEEFDRLSKKKNVERMVKYAEENFNLVRSNISDWDSLPDSVRKQRVITYVEAFLKLRQEFTDSKRLNETMQQLGAAGAKMGASEVADRFATVGATTAAQPKPEGEKTPFPPDKDGGSDSGGKKEKSFLEELLEGIDANARLYLNLEKGMKGYIKNRGKFIGAFQKLRGKGISEEIIESLGTGPEALKKARELLNMGNKARKELIRDLQRVSVGEAVEGLRRSRAKEEQKLSATKKVSSMPEDQREIILADEALTKAFATTKKGSVEYDKLEKLVRRLAKAKKELREATETEEEAQIAANEAVIKALQLEMDLMRQRAEQDFAQETGMTVFAAKELISANEFKIKQYQREIDAIEKINQKDQDRISQLQRQKDMLQRQIDSIQKQIDLLERQKEAINRQIQSMERANELDQRKIEAMERANELDQRRIEPLQREEEMRNRVSESISRELEIMSQQEEQIRKTHEERVKALDKIESINERIVRQQQQQLGLSRAIAEGDIYAATAAAQEMRAQAAQDARTMMREGLERSLEQQVSGLTTSGGLTREEAEGRLRDIREQSYQTTLRIKEIEDQIYARTQAMIPLRDQIYNRTQAMIPLRDQIYELDLRIREENDKMIPIRDQMVFLDGQILELNDQIFERNLEIKAIQEEKIDPLIVENDETQNLLDKLEHRINEESRQHRERVAQLERQNQFIAASVDGSRNLRNMTEQAKQKADSLASSWREVAKAARDAANAMGSAGGGNFAGGLIGMAMGGKIKRYGMGGKTKKYPMGGLIPYAIGGVAGDGGRDSVNAMLTPGEFVVRKSMVKKYGTPMMEAINQGAYQLPRYEIEGYQAEAPTTVINKTTAVNAPVYNNYDMKFAVSGTNASADEIANKVMFKMKQVQGQQIRSNRGY